MSAISAEMETQLEQEWAREAGSARELESELVHEFEAQEHEAAAPEMEFEHEGVAEQEQLSFFNHLAAMADRGGRSQALRRIALAAARETLRAHRQIMPVIEGEMESEFEQTPELSFELESALNPVARTHGLALMEHMAHEAASAETEQEAAEQFLPLIPLAAKAIIPLAARALPGLARRVAPTLIRRVAPQLVRGVSQMTRTLFRSPVTRPLIRTIPSIARRTMVNLARQQAAGRNVTSQGALRTLARQAVQTLGNPQAAVTAFRRARALDRPIQVTRPTVPARQPTYSAGWQGGAQIPVVAVVPCPWHSRAGEQSWGVRH
jgi:hypothetical protein